MMKKTSGYEGNRSTEFKIRSHFDSRVTQKHNESSALATLLVVMKRLACVQD